MDLSMNAAVCQALVSLYPLVMLTAVVERRSIAIRMRRRAWFRQGIIYVVGAATVGMVFALIGTQTKGLYGVMAVAGWVACILGVGGLIATVLASMASTEVAEDASGV